MDQRQDGRRDTGRFTVPPVRIHFKQINIFVHFLTLLAFFATVFNVHNGVRHGTATEITLGIFLGVIFGLLTVSLYSYSRAIQEFLNEESLSNFEKAMERQCAFWFLVFILSCLYTVVYFIFG